jgi:aconitate hydratase
MAGPRRPQDRVPVRGVQSSFRRAFPAAVAAPAPGGGLGHGSVVIAAITSCTNTSNPSVMVAAGLVAKKAVERGLRSKPWVKTSLAPGSKVVTRYLQDAGLAPYLEQLGFFTVGYGCTTCIGNSGPLAEEVEATVAAEGLIVSAVLSGNRNFEGRVHALVRANYLASPPLVVAYALAGSVDLDLTRDALGVGTDGRPVYLADIWPTQEEVRAASGAALRPDLFREHYADVFSGNPTWNAVAVPEADAYQFDPASTYIQEPPFFAQMTLEPPPQSDILGARVLLSLGDSVTTDHISPAGSIPSDSAAGRYLLSLGVPEIDFNQYGTRRGNHEVMMRGTFANVRIRNRLTPGVEGGYTVYQPSGEVTAVYEAAMRYQADSTPLIVLAGKEYGTGSSRDWAAKGPALLGVRAVLAESFERIHRSNLVGMGILPLQYLSGESADGLGLTGFERFEITGIGDGVLSPKEVLPVLAIDAAGHIVRFRVVARIDTPVEAEYYRNGGILQTVLRQMLRG